jgi:hypothetical protein
VSRTMWGSRSMVKLVRSTISSMFIVLSMR